MSSSLMAAAMSSGSSLLEGSRSTGGGGGSLMPSNLSASAAQFREIHKNTWLKRLTAEGKKITIGPKKSERSWVVFCVHDDTEALLEGYAEPRQAASHSPEWIVSLQDTLHISHALIPNSHEFEFVVTLSNEVLRFHAMSWEIMQEWVETLRSKLREMKILSPRENLYTKLPEIRAPLLPTRDPTSPLPAPPPVPAALVPGVERVVPQSAMQESTVTTAATESNTTTVAPPAVNPTTTTSNNSSSLPLLSSSSSTMPSSTAAVPITMTPFTSMSNTLTQNLLNMLSDPISTYSEHLNDEAAEDSNLADDDDDDDSSSEKDLDLSDFNDKYLPLLLRKSSVLLGGNQQAAGTSSAAENSFRVDIGAENRSSADQIKNFENLFQCERLIPRPQTSRSQSAGAADKSRKQTAKFAPHHNTSSNALTTCSSNNITELEICSETTNQSIVTTCPETSTSTNTDTTTSADSKTNITIIQVSTNAASNQENESDPPKLPTKSAIGEIFKFPEAHTAAAATTTKTKQHEYKSNVQIIPSNLNSSTIQVLGQHNVAATAVANQYSTPVKKSPQSAASNASTTSIVTTTTTTGAHVDNNKITTVHVAGDASQTNSSTTTMYGTCYTPNTVASQSTPKLPKKIILSANTSGITNISVNNASDPTNDETAAIRNNGGTANVSAAAGDSGVKHNVGNVHYEKVFLSSSIPITTAASTTTISTTTVPASPKLSTQWNWPRRQTQASVSSSTQTASHAAAVEVVTSALPTSSAPTSDTKTVKPPTASHNRNMSAPLSHITGVGGSPAMQRRRVASPTNVRLTERSSQPPLPTRPPFLTRGLTEAVITTRPSRKDFHFLKLTPSKTKSNIGGNNGSSSAKNTGTTSNNNGETPSTSTNSAHQPLHAAVNRANSESLEQRRRSSSTSDAQAQRNTRGTNNNEFPGNRAGSSALRIQQPPQPFRSGSNAENGGGNGSGGVSPPTTTTSPAAKRLTLREQQVMQLRREIMHPGGVRLQLRRKDCVGSIAWVDAFGAVWVAGWKQKEHPVLYNALHIGDQLLSVAGITTSSAAETNKIIRNANTLFVEVLVRRIPFGRGYAIRREREGQCLGLIRDGNTSTIVDVVPNSLAARHGLPPKAQSCDGTTLTFWMLTEINGRPLNLFFKENEIRDRLNSVGRDISILVQPSDLITKLKKQLKSLRGYKDYLVQ